MFLKSGVELLDELNEAGQGVRVIGAGDEDDHLWPERSQRLDLLSGPSPVFSARWSHDMEQAGVSTLRCF